MTVCEGSRVCERREGGASGFERSGRPILDSCSLKSQLVLPKLGYDRAIISPNIPQQIVHQPEKTPRGQVVGAGRG